MVGRVVRWVVGGYGGSGGLFWEGSGLWWWVMTVVVG